MITLFSPKTIRSNRTYKQLAPHGQRNVILKSRISIGQQPKRFMRAVS